MKLIVRIGRLLGENNLSDIQIRKRLVPFQRNVVKSQSKRLGLSRRQFIPPTTHDSHQLPADLLSVSFTKDAVNIDDAQCARSPVGEFTFDGNDGLLKKAFFLSADSSIKLSTKDRARVRCYPAKPPVFSKASATRSIFASSKWLVRICMPTGNPADDVPHGTLTPAIPAKLAVIV